MKTLIVDDDIFNCKLLQSILKDYGDCAIAMSGISALQLFEEALKSDEHYDLVCLDIMMPEKDGYETLREMRIFEQNQNPPPNKRSQIIMITALEEPESKTKAFYENCNGYLVKPVERKLLEEMLNKMKLI